MVSVHHKDDEVSHVAFLGLTEVRFGEPEPSWPQGWKTLGVPEFMDVGDVAPLRGYHYIGVRDRRKKPVIYVPGRGRGLVIGSDYALLTSEALEKAKKKRPDVWGSPRKTNTSKKKSSRSKRKNPSMRDIMRDAMK